jgi:STAS domain
MTLDVASTGHLAFDGALTIRTAEAVCAQLLDAIKQHTSLSIDCSAATEVDLSFIQLLIAARVSAGLLQHDVVLDRRPDGALLDAMTRGGFPDPQQGQGGEATAFWFGGTD